MNRNNIVTVFAQGNQASRSQGAKYAGKEGIHIGGPFSHHAVAPNAPPQLMYGPYCYPEFKDVSYEWSWNPIHMMNKAVSFLRNQWYGIQQPHLWHTVWSEVNVAGAQDVTQYRTAVEQCIGEHPDKNIVLYGVSRGAATVLSSVAQMSSREQSRVSLVIVEAPFDSVENVTNRYTRAFLYWVTKYRSWRMSPAEAIDNWPLRVPVLFVAALDDHRVPCTQTLGLAKKLTMRGHRMVNVLCMEKGGHNGMVLQKEYKDFVEVMYDRYCQPIPRQVVETVTEGNRSSGRRRRARKQFKD